MQIFFNILACLGGGAVLFFLILLFAVWCGSPEYD